MTPDDQSEKNERPIEFKLSDAPIHRIQTLAFAFHDAILRLPGGGFKPTDAPVFVRRDFDSPFSERSEPVFNATFYRREVTERPWDSVFNISNFSVILDRIHKAALNSLETPRQALERAVQHIKRSSANGKPTTMTVNSWLELYSRIPYEGGLPSFISKQFAENESFPTILLAGARKTDRVDKNENAIFEDRLFLLPDNDNSPEQYSVIVPDPDFADQPPLRVASSTPNGSDEISTEDQMYQVIQQVVDPTTGGKPWEEGFVIVLPVYDFLDVTKSDQVIPCGAFLGFLFLPLTIQGKEEAYKALNDAKKELHCVAPLINRFAWGFLRAEFDEILSEDYAGDDPLKFLEKNAHRVDGWKFEIPKEPPAQPLIARRNDDGEEVLTIDLRPDLFSSAEFHPAITLKRKAWTRWDPGMKQCNLNIARRIRYFYEQAVLQNAMTRAGQRSGILASAHDYSKDVGPILSQLTEYGEKIRSSMKTIQTEADRLSSLPSPAPEILDRIKEELEELQTKPTPRFGWFAATRFLNAHLVTQTRGVLLPEPVECVKMLEAGTLADLDEIVRLLVWHPVSIQELKDRERKYTKWSPEKLRMSSTWWTLFSFDLDPVPASRPFREKLGQRVCSLILDEEIDQPAFAERFQVPHIKIVNDLDEPVSCLWPDGDAERWRPLDGLLPLLVFSTRFAFQCAWAKTILEEAKGPLAIRITPSKPEPRKNQFQISFPSLTSPGSPMEEHPYFREWEGQIGHYRGQLVWKSSPWKAVAGTTPVTHESWGDISQITLTATI